MTPPACTVQRYGFGTGRRCGAASRAEVVRVRGSTWRHVRGGRWSLPLKTAAAKAWRYVAEMEEIAATQAEAGLTPDLFRAMAAVYAELAERAVAASPEDVPDGLPLEEVIDRLSEGGAGRAAAEAPRPGA